MRVYRLEHRDTRNGIFRAFPSDRVADEIVCRAHHDGPRPHEDGLGEGYNPDEIYGVARVEQLHDWFDLAMLAKHLPLLVAAEYSVPAKYVRHGGRQVAYLASKATKVRNIPWKELI